MEQTNKQTAPSPSQDSGDIPKKTHSKKRILMLILLAVAVTVCIVGGISAFITWKNNAEVAAMKESVKNTLDLQQMKFQVDFNKPKSKNNLYPENIKVDGVYKKGAGLSASTVSMLNTADIKEVRKSKWVIDNSANIYGNLSFFDLEAVPGGSMKSIATEKEIQETSNKIKDMWMQYGTKNLNHTYDLYGIQACTLVMLYELQSQPSVLQDLLTQLSGPLKIRKTDSTSGTDTYTIATSSGDFTTIGKHYKESGLYKMLVGCNKEAFTATDEAINEVLKGLSVTVKVDTAKKLVSSLSIKSKDMFDFNATFASASGTTITIPDNPEKLQSVPKDSGTTSEDISKKMPNVSDSDYLEYSQYLKDYVKNGVSKDTKVQVIDDWRPYTTTE